MADLDLIIFDCDGVLVDSEYLAAQIEAEQLTKAGYEISAEDFAERFAGMTSKEIFMAVEQEANIPLQASMLDETHRLLDEKLIKEVEMIEGARAAIEAIDLPRCICSNSPMSRLDGMLKRTRLFDLFQDKIYSSRIVREGRPKPHPDVYLHAIDEMDAEADYTIVIEDSESGVKAAKAAGARVIGFTGATHSFTGHSERLMDAGAETTINRMQDLPAMVEALAGWSELK